MGKLIITESSGVSRELLLDKERVTIGRHADNDIYLNDKAVSGHHAVIITILADSFLEDLDSTNGTLVNGKQIAKHSLSNDDTVTIGRNSLRYAADQPGSGESFDKTMIPQPSQVAAVTNGPAPAPANNKRLTGRLQVADGANAGRELELTKVLTTIGKPGVQVAAITQRSDGYYIVHVGGAAGGKRPLVNSREIDTEAHKLAQDDIIELAGTKMRFLLS